MRFLVAALLLAATPALAQQGAQYTPTSEMLLRQALMCEGIATAQHNQAQSRVADLAKQIADLTKERDELKAAKP